VTTVIASFRLEIGLITTGLVSVRPRSTKLQESHQFAASAVDQRSRHLKPSLLRPFRCFGLLVSDTRDKKPRRLAFRDRDSRSTRRGAERLVSSLKNGRICRRRGRHLSPT
jgi:hypothetical protein